MRARATTAMAAVLLCAASLGSAQTAPPGQFENYGVGTKSCGEWLAVRKGTGTASYELLQWVLGWVSAAGYYDVRGDLRVTDGHALAAWVDKYCRENPLYTIQIAAMSLVDELAKPK